MKDFFIRRIDKDSPYLGVYSTELLPDDTAHYITITSVFPPVIVGGFTNESQRLFYEKGKKLTMKTKHSCNSWGKFIGKLSDAAIWVKEGDRIALTDIKIHQAPEGFSQDETTVTIKCPTCNTFH